MSTDSYLETDAKTVARLLREAGGPSTGAARLLRELVRRGLDEDALVPTAMIAVELDSMARPNVQSLIGQRFGRLVVIAHAGRERHRLYWLCHCDCGREKKIRGDSLLGANTTSCGCFQRELFEQHRRRRGRPEVMATVARSV